MQQGPWQRYGGGVATTPAAPAQPQSGPWSRYGAAAPPPVQAPPPQAASVARPAPSRPAPVSAPAASGGLSREDRIGALLDQQYSPDDAIRLADEQIAFEGGQASPLAGQGAGTPFVPTPTTPRGSQDNPIDLTQPLMADDVPLLVQGNYVRGRDGVVYALPGNAYTAAPRQSDEAQGSGIYIRRPNATDKIDAFTQAMGEQVPGLDEAAAAVTGVTTGRGFDAMREQQQLSRMLQNQTDRDARIAGGIAGFGLSLAAPGGSWVNGVTGAARVGRAAALGAGYGGVFGFGNTDGDLRERATAAGLQATGGALGGAVIQRGADRLAAAAANARANPSAQRQLADAGVLLTPGQMMGGAPQRIEDGLTSTPILGDAIRDARRRGLESFNAAAINEAVAPVGTVGNIGRQGQAEAQQVVSGAYDNALQGVSVPRDPQLDADLTALGRTNLLPQELQSGFNSLINRYIARFGQGVDGEAWKQLDAEIGAAITSAENGATTNPINRLLADKLRDTRRAFQSALERADPLARESVRRADLANAGLARVRDAGQRQGTAARDGLFTPGDLNAAVRAGDNTAGNRAYAGGNALLQRLSDNAASVLPSQVPDSGTPFRSVLNLLLPAAGVGGLSALGVPGAAPVAVATGLGIIGGSALYGRGIQGVINRAYRASTPGAARQALADLQAAAAQSPVLQPVYEALQRQLRPLLLGEQTARSTTP